METTLVLVKPDGMRRRLAGEIVARLERRGLELRGARAHRRAWRSRPSSAQASTQAQAHLLRACGQHLRRPELG